MKRRLRNLAICLATILFFHLQLSAQQTITGTLKSPSGEPVVGATVSVRGMNKTAVTDANGRFTIAAPPGSVLEVSSVGFQPTNITVTGSEINEVMQISNASLNEVVVIGYQAVRRRDLTGAVGVINPQQANRNMSNTVAESIQGLAAGVTVRNSGAP